MKKRIVIEFDIVNNAVGIAENDFTTFESFGVIEAAKQMIADAWLHGTDESEKFTD